MYGEYDEMKRKIQELTSELTVSALRVAGTTGRLLCSDAAEAIEMGQTSILG